MLLPPNLSVAAGRSAIAVRIELDLGTAPEASLLPALALIQRWCGAAAKPPFFVQLKRSQLRELIDALDGQPLFFFVNRPGAPVAWVEGGLAGVSEHLEEPVQVTPASAPEPEPRKPPKHAAPEGEPATVDGSEHFVSITLPSREHPSYEAIRDLVKAHGFVLEPSNRRWWLRDRHKALNFIALHAVRLRDAFGARFTANYTKNTTHLRSAEVQTEITSDPESAGAAFNLTLAVTAADIPASEVHLALAANRGYVEHAGRVVLLDPTRIAKLSAAQARLSGAPMAGTPDARRSFRISAARAAAAQDVIEELSPDFRPPEAWKMHAEPLRNLSKLSPAPLAKEFDAHLRPYQKLGVAWLWHLWQQRLGGVLADEMGLGKTLQALGLLSAVASQSVAEAARLSSIRVGKTASRNETPARLGEVPEERRRARSATSPQSTPSLVVAPASLLENWRRESERFTPRLRVFVHHGGNRIANRDTFVAWDIVITSYGTLARDRALFEGVRFACVVADEAQHIKNRRSQNAVTLRSLSASARFLLTGTPLENSLDDLRSLFDFLLPGYLDRPPEGLRGEEKIWHDRRLRDLTAPYILRRTKQAVAPELPSKIEQIVWCEFSPDQDALYRSIQQESERELGKLAAGGASENRLRLAALTQLLRLRQVCCDPRLLPSQSGQADATPPGSVKLDALMELLAEAVDDGHRVLVFSQFTSLLDLLQEALKGEGITLCRLDGSMSRTARQAAVDRFQSDPTVPVFLLSLKAGGTGLNLTGADTIVHYDPWWNPAVEAQATDRAHRIGQTRVVTSYKLIVSGSVEEKVLALQDTKKALLADVFEASDAAAAKLSLTDLRELIGR